MTKLGTVIHQGNERVAALLNDGLACLLPAALGDMVSLIEQGEMGVAAAREAVQAANRQIVDLTEVELCAPIRRYRRDVLCTGWNYWDHFYESAGRREGQDVSKPTAPTFFTKGPDTVIGPYEDIAYDEKVSTKWDYEAEIVVVIGKSGRSIPTAAAMEHVFGYCLANDVSQRDLQRRHGGQWLKGKSIDRTMPLGPWITLRDDIDLKSVVIECELNGRLMQHASALDMAFSIGELIAELSMGMTLQAGDILLTGTPSGIGNARTPPVFLQAGDLVEVRATGLGKLVNRLVPTDLKSYSGRGRQ